MNTHEKSFGEKRGILEIGTPKENEKVVVFSDIHSNLESFNLLLRYCKDQDINKLICLGDIIGKNFPENNNDLIEKIRNEKKIIAIVKGNWDYSEPPSYLDKERKEKYREKIDYVFSHISDDNKKWLDNLKERIEIGDMSLTHIPGGKLGIYKVSDFLRAEDEKTKKRIVLFGHTHEQEVFEKKNSDFKQLRFSNVFLRNNCKYFINPGSLGIDYRFGVIEPYRWNFFNLKAIYK